MHKMGKPKIMFDTLLFERIQTIAEAFIFKVALYKFTNIKYNTYKLRNMHKYNFTFVGHKIVRSRKLENMLSTERSSE